MQSIQLALSSTWNCINPWAEEQARIQCLMETLKQNALGWKLYQDATREVQRSGIDSIKIRITSNPELDYFTAMFCHNSAEIQIARELDFYNQLSLLIFELTNAYQTNKHLEIIAKLKQRKIRRSYFIWRREEIENIGTHIHHKVARFGVLNLGWPKEVDVYNEEVLRPFKELYPNIDPVHKEYYGKYWDNHHY